MPKVSITITSGDLCTMNTVITAMLQDRAFFPNLVIYYRYLSTWNSQQPKDDISLISSGANDTKKNLNISIRKTELGYFKGIVITKA